MKASEMQALLDKAHRLKQPERERTQFDIGALGYFDTDNRLARFLSAQ